MTSENISPFIDFVVCPSYQMAYKEDILEYYGLDRNGYVKGESFYGTKDGENVDPRDLFDKITYNVSEMFHKIVVSTLNQNKPKILDQKTPYQNF